MSLIRAALLSFALLAGLAAPAFANAHDAFTRLLTRYVVVDNAGATFVDYAAFKASKADMRALDDYIAGLAAQDLFAMSDTDEQFAAWANLYNAVTLDLVLDAYPVSSIRKVKGGVFNRGPWKKDVVTVAGRTLSLDAIEHDILRKQWGDPRIHYAVNCASIGCPNLRTQAWEGASLNLDLDDAARAYVNHSRGVAVTPDGTLRLSSIYQWYRADFGGDGAGVRAHLSRFANDDLAATLAGSPEITGYDYDWSLNDIRARSAGK